MIKYPAVVHQGHFNFPLEFDTFCDYALQYGAKATGLFLVPVIWVPEFCAVSVELYKQWVGTKKLNDEILNQIISWIDSKDLKSIIVRSSSKNERITDRGKYRSFQAENTDRSSLEKAILQVFEHASCTDDSDEMALIIQDYKSSVIDGHLSNEVRLSPTRNQWSYETEGGPKGINIRTATSPDPALPLNASKQVHQILRSLARWCCDTFKPRCHIEWLLENNQVRVVQLDFEWREFDNGVDPSKALSSSQNEIPKRDGLYLLRQYLIGTQTRWKKLQNLSEFDFSEDNPAPIIFQLSADVVQCASDNETVRSSLINEIRLATGNRAVVRTDVDQPDYPRFNLPRTETVTAKDALLWCEKNLIELLGKGARQENIMFLVHAFLPAVASAWTYASPDQQDVQVDALWGLPDGMQVLPVDSYEVIPIRKKIIPTGSTYKPMFLNETEDGSWSYVNVLRSKGRSKVLSNQDILDIASRTKKIAEKLGEFAQIMWFCGVPEEYGVGRNVPWFRCRDKIDSSSRQDNKYKSFIVRNTSDLSNLPSSGVAIEFKPEADQIRNDDFLDAVIAKAKEYKLPVKLNGSVLGHVYYKLCQEKIGIILPNAKKYRRKRERKVFGKLVRDKIPSNISDGGETAREAQLRKDEVMHALSGKVLEELLELIQANDNDEKLAELADVLEVVRGIAHELNVDWLDVEARANDKKRAGGFEQRKILLETSLARSVKSLETIGEVGLDELASPIISDKHVDIPLAGLFNLLRRRNVMISLAGAGVQLKIEIKSGMLRIQVLPRTIMNVDEDVQGTLF